ncbi:MAG: DNA-directed RNA polymerase subunit H [Candidatus Diapherotrites archaeon]|nr:DNA-directed RNA polymerase subunit H [Candidatus Diapherotrites archaeon]
MVFTVSDHFLVPKHILLSKEEAEELFKKYGLQLNQLPQILLSDPAIAELLPRKGDIVKIIRNSPTAGKTIYYRMVV